MIITKLFKIKEMRFLRNLLNKMEQGLNPKIEKTIDISQTITNEIKNDVKYFYPVSDEVRIKIIDNIVSVFVANKLNHSNLNGDVLDPGERDELFEDAARLIVSSQLGSTALLQRKLKLGYNRAGRIIDQLESAGIVGPFEGDKAREVKIRNEVALENFFDYSGFINYSYLDYDQSVHRLIEEGTIEQFCEENHDEIKKSIEEELWKKHEENIKVQQEELDYQEKEKIKAKMLAQERKRRLHYEAKSELIEKGELFQKYDNNKKLRERIPREIMDDVWNRDSGKCVLCGSGENLEFDHIIPHSKGGATSYRNLQILCKRCNIQKSNKIGI